VPHRNSTRARRIDTYGLGATHDIPMDGQARRALMFLRDSRQEPGGSSTRQQARATIDRIGRRRNHHRNVNTAVRSTLRVVALCVVAALAYGIWMLSRLAPIATAYTAQSLCAGVFVSGRAANEVLTEDILADNHPLLRLVSPAVNEQGAQVSAAFLGTRVRASRYRPGMGCTLVLGDAAPETPAVQVVQPITASVAPEPVSPATALDPQRLERALDWAFEGPQTRRTRAVVILQDGHPVAERYAPGFSARTPMPGWSMTKTVTGALAGVLVKEGKVSLDSAALLDEWRAPGDARAAIRLDQLLRMTDGLAFTERYDDPLSDVVLMLLTQPDDSAFAASKPLQHAPGTHWRYSSGTTNVLMRALRRAAGSSPAEFAQWPRRALFAPLGMDSALIEVDAADMPIGSSYMYATARDWARFGQFLLQDGVWNGVRLLPEGWVRYMTTPTAQDGTASYGAQVWVGLPEPYRSSIPAPLPPGAFHMIGHEGQLLSVIPSHKLVVLRLGLARRRGSWDQEAFLARVLDAFR
jgi:CubicO group peptidase (beta-lactamase class C family)